VIKTRQRDVYITSDGAEHLTEEAARLRELGLSVSRHGLKLNGTQFHLLQECPQEICDILADLGYRPSPKGSS